MTGQDSKESQQVSGTHELSSIERATNKESERKPASKGNSPTAKHRGRDKSGQRKKASE